MPRTEEKPGLSALTKKDIITSSSEDVNDESEVKDYLMFTIRLARKKMQSHKLPDVVKVKFLKVGVDSAKCLLFSGVLNKNQRREVSAFQAFFLAVREKQAENKIPHSTDN